MEAAHALVGRLADAPTTPVMPLLFVGHGNPMNAITDNDYARAWERIGASLAPPTAILCVSAHWETRGTWVTAMERPRTIHDFGGFPQELFDVQYPAPGSPTIATDITTATAHTIGLDHAWGLDHGAWSVLKRMFPAADVPVLQLSLDTRRTPAEHVVLARDLAGLRRKGILIVGSGNIVHNLRRMRFEGDAYDWALEFDETSKKLIAGRAVDTLARYDRLGEAARQAIPTNEHYLPMLYSLAMVGKDEGLQFFNERIDLGSVSMRSFLATA